MYALESVWCKVQNQKAYVFWSEFLKRKDIQWKENTQKLIRTVLTIPIGSSDVERSFSILNQIKTKQRGNLESPTIDALVRIKLNGPDEISKFRAMKYAKYWVNEQKNKLVDDPLRIIEKNR